MNGKVGEQDGGRTGVTVGEQANLKAPSLETMPSKLLSVFSDIVLPFKLPRQRFWYVFQAADD